MSLVYVSGYSEPMGHIKGDQLIAGIHALRLGADGRLSPANNSVATAGAPHILALSPLPLIIFLVQI